MPYFLLSLMESLALFPGQIPDVDLVYQPGRLPCTALGFPLALGNPALRCSLPPPLRLPFARSVLKPRWLQCWPIRSNLPAR